MKRKQTALLLISSIALSLISSCSNKEESKWSYTKEDMSSFLNLEAGLSSNGDDALVYSADTDVPLFSENIDSDDVIVFDSDKAAEIMKEKKKDYADYATLKEASVPITGVETLKDNDGFNVTFASSASSNYGMLIHSSVTASKKYMMVSKDEDEASFASDPQSEFEEKYVKSVFSWNDGGKFIFQLVSNIGMVIVGASSENPGAIASGIFGVLGTLAESLGGGGATIQGVMDQLKETDRKIDELSEKIDKNTKQLSDAITRTQASVEENNLNTLNLAINDFANNSIAPINTFNRNLADEAGFYYRDFVKSEQTVKLVLTKKENGVYASSSLMELGDDPQYNFSLAIADFPHAKAHLSSNGNVVKAGFMDELGKDIDEAIASKTDLPEGINKEHLNSFVASMIYEQFMKKHFSSNVAKAQEYRNLLIDYAERILGASGRVSILSTYLSRLQCMYNFAGEIKPLVRALSTNLLQILDMNVARAGQACLFALVNDEDLEKDYKSAREAIQKLYSNLSQTPSSYSFVVSSSLTGGFYQFAYNTSYSNPGNYCELKVTSSAERLEMNDGNIVRTKDNMADHSGLSVNDHSHIASRWGLLRASGSADADVDYIHYLGLNGIISSSSLDAAESLISWQQASPSSYRILTNDRTEREMHDSDSSTALKCQAKGNPGGDYFELNKVYDYSKTHTSSYWYGKTYEGAFVDALTGAGLGSQKIASWARYAESHWYWANDEYWSFVDDISDNYFFLVDVVTAK